jgi:hypothetical protein
VRNRCPAMLIAVLLSVMTLGADEALGQEAPSYAFRISAGVGGGDMGIEGPSLALHGGLTLSRNQREALTLRVGFVQTDPPGQSSDPNSWDIGVLYGRQASSSRAFASVSAGVALVGSEYADRTTSSTVGLPGEVEVGLVLADFLAVKGTLFGNLNRNRNLFGGTFGLAIGKVR